MKRDGWRRIGCLLLCLTMLASLMAGCGGRRQPTVPEIPEPTHQSRTEPVSQTTGERDKTQTPTAERPSAAPEPIAPESIAEALEQVDAPEDGLSITVSSQDLEQVLDELLAVEGVEDARPVADNDETAVIIVTPTPGTDPTPALEELDSVDEVVPADETEIPLTDLAATWDGVRRDEDGNLNVPFDVAYPAAFSDESTKYSEDHLLLKTDKSFGGELTHELALCGFVSVERFMETEDGDWYRADLADGVPIATAIQKARSLTAVQTADYDYIVETDALEVPDFSENPRFSEQWYLQQYGIPTARKYLARNNVPAGGLPGVVVAVIDTGVDYTHPDLKANMWVNHGEIPGNGIDDDGNGYVDDIYGADMIAVTGDPMDDHGHGTHVAGIVAASNNKEGIVGVAYNAKIMAVKAGQASGYFNQSDVAEAILYAYNNGADVINMSFGGKAVSMAVQEALQTAYTRSVLVAAAGNDGSPNEETKWEEEPKPCYPAAFSYVIGVMSVDSANKESAFTNWDVNGFNTLEYEVYAPGEHILSTLPGGRYGFTSGTSMASPVVAGTAALLRSYFADRDMYPSRFIAAQISATSETSAVCFDSSRHETKKGNHYIPKIIDVYAALSKLPKPDVHLYDYYVTDNADGSVNAGDTLDIGLVLRNRWGMSSDTVVTIDALSDLGVADPYVEILTDTVDLGGVGTYNTKSMLIRDEDQIITGIENPLQVKIAPNCPNDYIITLHVTITYLNGLDDNDLTDYVTEEKIEITVRNGVVKKGQITADEIWTKDNYYIIPASLYIAEGVTVTVEPGTQIQFWAGDDNDPYADPTVPALLNVAGSFVVEGTAEEPVQMFPSDQKPQYAVRIQYTGSGFVKLQYVEVGNPSISANVVDHGKFYVVRYANDSSFYLIEKPGQSVRNAGVSAADITNCVFNNIKCLGIYGSIERCVFNQVAFMSMSVGGAGFTDCVFNGCEGSVVVAPNTIKGGVSRVISPSNGKRYAYVVVSDSHELGRILDYVLIRDFARKLGGDIACFETEEEFQQLCNSAPSNIGGAIIGLKHGADHWINGEPVGDWLQVAGGEGRYVCLISNNNVLSMTYTNSTNGILIEIPAEGTPDTAEGLAALWDPSETCVFHGNAILNNINNKPDQWLTFNTGGYTLNTVKGNLTNNWWGTINESIIERMIRDFDDDSTCFDINPYPYLTEPPADVWPFVTDAYLMDQNGERLTTVGNETAVFVVEFNRDMDTTQDLNVRFGAAEPYAEYQVSGSWVNPRRWEGIYTLKTTIENGTQYFSISGGRAADDHWMKLYEVPGRFAFEIDTTAAMSMMLQAEATDTGVQLNWMQDDYETLAGYNIYRATKEDGLYTKLNTTVIPVGEESFFDDTVEPGVLYYYNFTVVLSDMTESTPSGKVTIRSKDTMAPNIYHTPVHTAYTGSNLVIGATVTDNLALNSVTLFYRITGETDYRTAEMTAVNSKYTGLISAEQVTLAGLEYYIEAFDGVNYTRRGSAEEPYSITVQQAVDASAKGDVNGDGSITNLDALMILQAINDLLNLTEDQFQRADLNDDGELSAAEALRILKYVSGKVTTILG